MAQATKLLIMMVTLVAASTAVTASGLGGWTGLEPETAASDDVENSSAEFRNYSATRQTGQVNFIGSVFSGVTKVIDGFALIFEFPSMMSNLGVPQWAIDMITAPLPFFFGLFVVYMLTGRRTTKRI